MLDIFAPQAQLEESANDRTSRRCPLVGMLREFLGLFLDHVLRATSKSSCVLGVSKRSLAELEIHQIMFACVSVQVFCTSFWGHRNAVLTRVFAKKHAQKGDSAFKMCSNMDQEHLRLVRSLALSSSCDCGATCPPPGSILVLVLKDSEANSKNY